MHLDCLVDDGVDVRYRIHAYTVRMGTNCLDNRGRLSNRSFLDETITKYE